MLDAICYGDTVLTPEFKVDDKNRKQYFELLMAIYSTERRFHDSRRNAGIAASAKKGNYKGRGRIRIDKLAAQDIFLDYSAKKIKSAEASKMLGISKSTFLRRYKEYADAKQ